MNNLKAARQQGFTLIELMIVIAIVGILAAIALPAYQDYTVRAKMSEPLAAMAEAKTTVTEYYATRGGMPPSALAAGINTNPNKEIVASIQFSTTGANPLITAVVQSTIVPTGTTTFLMSGTVDATSRTIQWRCKEGGSSAIEAKYLPSNCRGT